MVLGSPDSEAAVSSVYAGPKDLTKAPESYVESQLKAAADIYAERNKLYGDNYKRFGHVMQILLGSVVLATTDDHNRFGVLVQVVAKVTRYCENFARGGHDDSLDDMAVYAMMLKELDFLANRTASFGGSKLNG